MLICALCCMSVNAQKVETKDLVGHWKNVVEEGVTMAGDIEMTILPDKASQVLYFGNGGAKMPIFDNNDYYLSDTIEDAWHGEKVGKSESGNYFVRNHRGKMVQNKVSFDKDGYLVLGPIDENDHSMVMRFQKMKKKE